MLRRLFIGLFNFDSYVRDRLMCRTTYALILLARTASRSSHPVSHLSLHQSENSSNAIKWSFVTGYEDIFCFHTMSGRTDLALTGRSTSYFLNSLSNSVQLAQPLAIFSNIYLINYLTLVETPLFVSDSKRRNASKIFLLVSKLAFLLSKFFRVLALSSIFLPSLLINMSAA